MSKDDNALIAEALVLLRAGGSARERGAQRLFEALSGRLLRYFQRHRVAAAEAEELVQDVFVSVLRGCENFRGEAPPAVWLWTIARNAMISHHRVRHPEMLSLDAEDGLPLPEATTLETPPWVRDCLHRQMARFQHDNPERAECIAAIALRDWGMAELAGFLGRSLAATKEYLSQCRKKLRTYLAECGESEGGW